ncbi:translation initiation factor IF-2-like [Panicum virgatum]|uniref:translation initiation factor IF-2-like n=1 Tax=Panicum virgatum TaxID=38727 RepID=UPI0019D517E7|nr:translation initiation factor IF-2-like [Panicum virgatum]
MWNTKLTNTDESRSQKSCIMGVQGAAGSARPPYAAALVAPAPGSRAGPPPPPPLPPPRARQAREHPQALLLRPAPLLLGSCAGPPPRAQPARAPLWALLSRPALLLAPRSRATKARPPPPPFRPTWPSTAPLRGRGLGPCCTARPPLPPEVGVRVVRSCWLLPLRPCTPHWGLWRRRLLPPAAGAASAAAGAAPGAAVAPGRRRRRPCSCDYRGPCCCGLPLWLQVLSGGS